jgi:very-short-patch-repair endonuclease/DNA polymerase III delta prime subunit
MTTALNNPPRGLFEPSAGVQYRLGHSLEKYFMSPPYASSPVSEKDQARDRVLRLFRFLQGWYALRQRPILRISETPWWLDMERLPNHPSILRYQPETKENGGKQQNIETEMVLLRVSRPDICRPPDPPPSVRDWLKPGWGDARREVAVNSPRIVRSEPLESAARNFDDDPRRPKAFAEWKEQWRIWADSERPAFEARDIFEKIYQVQARIERETMPPELLLGDGMLRWETPAGLVEHPILFKRVQLEFEPRIPAFRIIPTDQPTELYTSLLRKLPGIDGEKVGQWWREMEQEDLDLLDDVATDDFLKRLVHRLSRDGVFLATEAADDAEANPDRPTIRRQQLLFLQERTGRFDLALGQIVNRIEAGEPIPEHISRVVGIASDEAVLGEETRDGVTGSANEDAQILLTKPANEEQLQIARRLEEHGAVIVQGPPGTGKTHTIANLIGHLLAEGRSILVTSHTAKALRVLREQVDEAIRPLCVPLLDDDLEARRQFESSVQYIAERLANSDAAQLRRHAQTALERRKTLILRSRELRANLLETIQGEYRDIVISGKSFRPMKAAKLLTLGIGCDDWIPGMVTPGEPLPLTPAEIIDLYELNRTIPVDQEAEAMQPLPEPNRIPSPEHFAAMVRTMEELQKTPENGGKNWANVTTTGTPLEQIDRLRTLMKRLANAIDGWASTDAPNWRMPLVSLGLGRTEFLAPWEQLFREVENTVKLVAVEYKNSAQHGPELAGGIPAAEQLRLFRAILEFLKRGNRLSPWVLWRRYSWRRLLRQAKVNGQRPASIDDFRALVAKCGVEVCREKLALMWDRLLKPLGGPESASLGAEPEKLMEHHVREFRLLLDWNKQVWQPLLQELGGLGFGCNQLLSLSPLQPGLSGDALRVVALVKEKLPPCIESRLQWLRFRQIMQEFVALHEKIEEMAASAGNGIVFSMFLQAVKQCDPKLNEQTWQRLRELLDIRTRLLRRTELLHKLAQTAPAWAEAIQKRQPPHHGGQPPGDPEPAWRWRQLEQALCERHARDVQAVQRDIAKSSEMVMQATAEAVNSQAWAKQKDRIKLPQQQALVGWLQTIRRIGRGTGRRAPRLRAEARRQMEQCRDAVPVWIVPLSRLAENFEIQSGLFDVVIIDEASQCDILGLIALYIGKRVVVVGDNEQVSPDAVGELQDSIDKLIRELLSDIPSAQLFDGKQSIYDIAMRAFGGNLCLREHFRCAPEIIEFSNQLSYDGRIKPLREMSDVPIRPHTISHRVKNGFREKKFNQAEAMEIASLIVACIEQPEYREKTFGVISLLGDEQATHVDDLLRRHLEPTVFLQRRIVCGSPAQFQGDERDVIFISLVDASDPEGEPLSRRSEGPGAAVKKRFNVAASRARDQLWVVHSLDMENDLKVGDLRRRLIEHAANPGAVGQELDKALKHTESPFEKAVAEQLIRAGYRLRYQVPVGYYRVDLVVGGAKKWLAVECDGEKYHPPEQCQQDLERQMVLERLGWRFVRIRGSQFYRDPDTAMKPLLEQLEEMEIEKLGPHQEVESNQLHELQNRVIRRAAEIRSQWKKEEEENAEAEVESTLRSGGE